VLVVIESYYDDPTDAKTKRLPVYNLIVLNMKSKRVLRTIHAYRQATFPGKWASNDIYQFSGGAPSEKQGEVQYQYDAKKNRITGFSDKK
jgi:hypothetical protein